MPIGNAIVGATHTPQTLTWQDVAGAAWDLTGGTLSGTIQGKRGGSARAITGALAFTGTGDDGEFTWTYSIADLATAGDFWVRFISTYADSTTDKTRKASFEIEE